MERLILAAAAANDGARRTNGVPLAAKVVLEGFQNLGALPRRAAYEQQPGNAAPWPRASSQEASQLLEVVKRACGQAARDLLQNLRLTLSALSQGGIQASWPGLPLVTTLSKKRLTNDAM